MEKVIKRFWFFGWFGKKFVPEGCGLYSWRDMQPFWYEFFCNVLFFCSIVFRKWHGSLITPKIAIKLIRIINEKV